MLPFIGQNIARRHSCGEAEVLGQEQDIASVSIGSGTPQHVVKVDNMKANPQVFLELVKDM